MSGSVGKARRLEVNQPYVSCRRWGWPVGTPNCFVDLFENGGRACLGVLSSTRFFVLYKSEQIMKVIHKDSTPATVVLADLPIGTAFRLPVANILMIKTSISLEGRDGNIECNALDPETGKHASFNSELRVIPLPNAIFTY